MRCGSTSPVVRKILLRFLFGNTAFVRGCSVTDPAGVEGAATLLNKEGEHDSAKEAQTSSIWGFRQKRIKPWLLRNMSIKSLWLK